MTLKIYLLGQFNIANDAQPLQLNSRPAQSLLAYLAMTAGMTHRRERLAGLMWPESSDANARAYLRQALWRIRKALDDGALSPEEYLKISDLAVTFDAQSAYWLDVDQIQESDQNISLEELLQTADHYRGELLPGFYDEWIPPERDRIVAIYQGKMQQLLELLLLEQRWQEAIERGEQWIRLAHAPEQAFRALMKAYAGLDDQHLVKTTYERCQEVLEQELGLKPSGETVELYETLCRRKLRRQEQLTESPPARPARQPAFLNNPEQPLAEQTLFVARERELQDLDNLLDRALEGHGRVAFVTGEAGSGKTALLNEFAHRALRRHPDLILAGGSCNMHTGIGDPYLPFREILEMLTGDVEGRWVAGTINTNHARRLWDSLLLTTKAIVEQGPDLINTFVHGPAVYGRVSARNTAGDKACIEPFEVWQEQLKEMAGQSTTVALSPTMRQSGYFEQYTRALQDISRRRPLILLLDDLQWADLGSISLLFHLGRHIAGCRILILGAYRPEEIALGHGGERHPLEPLANEMRRLFGNNTLNLNEAQDRTFLDSILDSEPNQFDSSFRQLIYRQTHGNPLFTIELLRGMQERGDLRRNESGQWVEETALDWETLPARVEAVIAERIGRLARPLRTALRVASVEGEQFTAEALAHVLGMEESEILALLNSDLERKHRLVKAQRIERKGDIFLSRYRFQHSLFQTYLYNNLSAIERVHLHEQVGKALETLYQTEEDRAAISPQLARHFTEAQVNDKAIQYLHLAGKKAVELSAFRESLTLLKMSLLLLETMPPSPERDRQELSILLTYAIAIQGAEGTQAALETWTRAFELSRQAGRTVQSCVTLGELAISSYVRAEYKDALTLGEETLALARETHDPLLIALGHWYIGLASFGLAEYAQAQDHFSQTISFYNPQQHHRQFISLRGSDAGLSSLAYDSCCLWIQGHWDQAEDQCLKALAQARAFNHPFSLADVLTYAGCFYHKMKGDHQLQLKFSNELMQLFTTREGGEWQGTIISFRGDALARLGQPDEGIELLEKGMACNKAVDMYLNFTVYLCSLAEIYAGKNNINSAWTAINKAFAQAEASCEYYWLAELHRIKAKLLSMEGKDNAAQDSLKEALATARRQGAKSWELRSAVDLARLHQIHGDHAAVQAPLQPLVSWFLESTDSTTTAASLDLQKARTLLDSST